MSRIALDDSDIPVQVIEPGPTQTVAVGASSAQSTALAVNTTLVRVFSDTLCHLAFGDNPTATSSDFPLAADTEAYLRVQRTSKIAVIQNAAAGTLWITEAK